MQTIGLKLNRFVGDSFYLSAQAHSAFAGGAGAYSVWKDRGLLSAADLPMFAVGTVFAFFSAWLCIRWLIRYVSSNDFRAFAWYRIVFGGLVLLSAYTGWIDWRA